MEEEKQPNKDYSEDQQRLTKQETRGSNPGPGPTNKVTFVSYLSKQSPN